MKIIDSHLHLNEKISSDLRTIVETLDEDLIANKISRGVVLHLLIQKWDYRELADHINKSKTLKAFVNIDPASPKKLSDLDDAVKNYKYIGLKLHPRLQKFKLSDPGVIELCKYAGQINIPVLIDAFPDGNALMDGFHVTQFSQLALACSETQFIWAHFGGHYAIDFMMVAKRLQNVYLDMSYSWLYYNNSRVVSDIAYSMKSMKFDKIFYGSDYPDRTIQDSLKLSFEQFSKFDIEGQSLYKLVFQNANDFFKWDDL